MNKLRRMVVDEQRQILTFGLAVLVFLMTLFAHYLESASLPRVRSGGGRDQYASRRHDGSVNHAKRSIALAAISEIDLR